MLWHKILGAGGVGGGLNMGDFMNSTTYTGDSTTARAITTGIDLSTGEGMVWVNDTDSKADTPICDTNMGATNYLITNANDDLRTNTEALQSFDSDGFTVGTQSVYNNNTRTFVGWTFKSEAGVFDCLEYEGIAGATHNIAHALGEVPGAIIVKNKDDSGGTDHWYMYHRGLNGGVNPEDYFIRLSNSAGQTLDTSIWNSTAPTASVFSLSGSGGANEANEGGDTYSAYLFPHNDNVQCGNYVGNGSTTGPTVTLGFEPQWLLIKQADGANTGLVWDNARNTSNPRTDASQPFETASDLTSGYDVDFTATGFQPKTTALEVNSNTRSYVYIAIRKAD